ncbi:hypothetical protein [Streptomyces scopuliridis]|uniref:hypothetical protein n=1 Tax=Streptomyces scopuliridis TaxID=452529 RepID=UPI003422899C
MIATVFLIVTVAAGTVAICAGLGIHPEGHGTRRLPPEVRQLRQDLSAARHEAAGAGQYIAALESDLIALSHELEEVRGERDVLRAAVETAESRATDLEGQLAVADQAREDTTALRAALANAVPIRQDPRTPPTPITDLPPEYDEFVSGTATAWRAERTDRT